MKYIALGILITLAGVVSARAGFQSDENNYRPYIGSYGYSENELRMVVDTNGQGDFATGGEIFDDAQLRFEWWHQYNNYLKDSFILKMSALRYGILESWIDSLNDAGLNPDQTPEDDGQRFVGPAAGQVFNARNQPLHGVTKLTSDGGKDLVLPWAQASTEDDTQLMAMKTWNANRGFGDVTFAQPLMPVNSANPEDTWMPYAVPCLENSPVYWSGHIIYNDAADPSTRSAKSVTIPWHKLNEGASAQLAFTSDVKPVTFGRLNSMTNSVKLSQDKQYLSIYKGNGFVGMYFNIDGSASDQFISWPSIDVTDNLSYRIDDLISSVRSAQQDAANAESVAENAYRNVSNVYSNFTSYVSKNELSNSLQPITTQINTLNNSMTALNKRYTDSITQVNDSMAMLDSLGDFSHTISNAVAEVEAMKQSHLPTNAATTSTSAGPRAIKWQANPLKVAVYSYSIEQTGKYYFKKDGWPELVRTQIVFDTRGLTGPRNTERYNGYTYLGSNFPYPEDGDTDHLTPFFENNLDQVEYDRLAFATAFRVGDYIYIFKDYQTYGLGE